MSENDEQKVEHVTAQDEDCISEWLDEANMDECTFKMPRERFNQLNEMFPDLANAISEKNETVSFGVFCGHMIVAGVNSFREAIVKKRAKETILEILESLKD